MPRPFLRSPLNLIAVASLALCITFATAWAASHVWPTVPSRGWNIGGHTFSSDNGRITLADVSDDPEIDRHYDEPWTFFETTVHPIVSLNTPTTTNTVVLNVGWDSTIPVAQHIDHPLPGIIERVSFNSLHGSKSSGSFITAVTRRWQSFEIHYWLLVSISALIPLLTLPRAIREFQDRKLAKRLGVDAPIVRVRPADLRAPGRFTRILHVAVTLITAISVILFLVSISAWIYSHRRGGETWDIGQMPEDSWRWSLYAGTFSGSRNKMRLASGPEVYREMYILHLTCGLSTYTGPNYYSWNFRTPLWLPTALAALLPAWWLYRLPTRKRRRRLLKGLCPACCYDLRMTPEHCPECGLRIVRTG